MNNTDFNIRRSKTGVPCMWEAGGGWSRTGSATLIADPKGGKKTPLFVPRGGPLACGNHALIPVAAGDLIVVASHHGHDTIRVFRVTYVPPPPPSPSERDLADVDMLHVYSSGEWDTPPDPDMEGVIASARRKAHVYHCRGAYWIK